MPDLTTNLGLKKPIGTETVTRSAYNENLDILDNSVADKTAFSELQQNVAAHQAETATDAHEISNINGLQTALDGKSATSHNHAGVYEPVDTAIMRTDIAQTMGAVLTAQNNTSYTTKQVRNVIESTADASGGSNGDIWIKYV